MRSTPWVLLLLATLLGGCDGIISDPAGTAGSGPGGSGDRAAPLPDGLAMEDVPPTAMRRLSRAELDSTLRDLLGDETRPASQALPEDTQDPFDNDYTTQLPSAVLVEGMEAIAQASVRRALADPVLRSRLLPCEPTGPGDAACMRSFVESFGRRAFRRPLEDEEVADFLALQSLAVEAGDFWYGVEAIARAILMVPDFVFRVEIGTPVEGSPGVRRLGDFEIATRMSYLLWGTTPDDRLLDRAQAGELVPVESRAAIARAMLADSRAVGQVDRFHAMWLGYERMAHDADLVTAMRGETRALIEKVVFDDDASYLDLFRATETFLDPTLAEHYGIPHSGSGSEWVSYEGTQRQGLLSHGTVLSAFAKWDDTSPTQRGIFIRERLMCQTIPPPPPTVNADDPPESEASPCKWDRYEQHRASAGCAGCHSLVDPVGFGLERFDRMGRYREHDEGLTECRITGEGELVGVGAFSGPAELADLLVESGTLEGCAVRQLWRFAFGRHERADDESLIEGLVSERRGTPWKLSDLLIEVVTSPQFELVREDEALLSPATPAGGE